MAHPEKKQNFDALISYGWNRIAYNSLRSLAKRGLRVAIGDMTLWGMSQQSKYCNTKFVYPNFYRQPKDFIDCLKNKFAELKPEVYLPMHEETFVVAKYIRRFDNCGVKIPIHDFETLKSVHQKDLFAKICADLKLPAPKTIKPKNVDELSAVWRELSNNEKVVIKSINSNSAKGVFYAHSFEELKKIYSPLIEKLEPNQYPIIQEYITGFGYGVSMLFNHGKLRAKFTHKRLREKTATGGTSTKRVSVKNQLLEDIAERLLVALDWHGIAMVEFKYDEETKDARLIEVNPRFWGSLALAINSGVDFPYLLYKMARDGDVEPVLNYQTNIMTRWLLGDALATISAIKKNLSLKPLVDFLNFKNEQYDDFYWDDLNPFFSESAYYLKKFIKTASVNPTTESLIDIDNI